MMAQPWGVDHDAFTPESDPPSSPRTELLSPPFEGDDFPSPSGRIPRGPGVKFRHERERAHSTASSRDLLQMLINEEYESKQTRKVLYTAFDRLEHETRRADAAEARIDDTIQRARAINEARITAQQQAVRAQEELKLYKLQLDNAQKEILRAQDVLKAIEAQRDDAEAAAVSARSKARRLNEERLIELAREEGRRLGFEEGVRRGRRMGYREAYDVEMKDRHHEMQDVVDRLLEARDEPERIEVVEHPIPIPVPPPSASTTTPAVHRLETPINSSLENQRHSSRGRRDSSDNASRSTPRSILDPVILPTPTVVEPRIISSTTSVPTASGQGSRPPSVSQPWPGPIEPPFSRPVSVQNSPRSVRHSEALLPDGYIPTADANHHISLPPPHELQRNLSSPAPSQQTLGVASERGRSSDYLYDSYAPPLRRASPDESLASTKQSAASSISQLDLVGLPFGARRDRSQGLSVIHEDASMRSERMTDYSQTIASASPAEHSSFREMPSNETLRRERKAKQHLADELRYADPSEAEKWRRQAENLRSQQPPDGLPRHRPSQITVPMPLSPAGDLQPPDSRHRRTTSERQGRSEARRERRDQRRPLSSDSSVPEINVEPPSGPPSIASSRGRRNFPVSGLLSPDHANRPLPPPAHPSSGGSPASNSPVIPPAHLTGQIYAGPPDRQVPPSLVPGSPADGPYQGPVMPNHTGGGAPSQRYGVPSRPPSERETGRPRSPISFYAPSPVPSGVTYPVPPISRSATYNASVGSNPSVTSEGRRRRDSLSATAGMTPAMWGKPMSSTGSSTDDGGGGVSNRHSRIPRQQSSASLASQQSRPSRSIPYSNILYQGSADEFTDP